MSRWWRLARAPNLVLAAGGVVAGGWIGMATLAAPTPLLWAALSAIGLGAAGNRVNDVFDVPADRINRRAGRPLATGAVTLRAVALAALAAAVLGLGAAALSGRLVLTVGAAALAVMLCYSPYLKPVPMLGNVAVAVVAGVPLYYGALAVGRPQAGIVPWVLAAALHLVREMVKDLDDELGDRFTQRRTLAVVLGVRKAAVAASVAAITFVPLSLLLPFRAHYGGAYYVFALPAQMAVLITAAQLLMGQTARAPLLLKGAMVTGVVALVTGRVA
jgi:geranylgeranylglycerol-phosphate geranylgeranyltransferase